jgi:hypothetical protein
LSITDISAGFIFLWIITRSSRVNGSSYVCNVVGVVSLVVIGIECCEGREDGCFVWGGGSVSQDVIRGLFGIPLTEVELGGVYC